MAVKERTVGRRIATGFTVILAILVGMGLASFFGVAGIVDNGREVIDGNQLDGELAQKEVDHLVWAKQVNALLADAKVTTLDVQLDPRQCGFGKWYYGEGRRQAEALVPSLGPLLAKIDEPHRRLHESAGEIGRVFRQPHPGLALTLSRRLTDHVQWTATVNRSLAAEAGGFHAYRLSVRNAVDQVLGAVAELESNQSLGPESSRRRLAYEVAQASKFGEKNFVFILDENLTMQAHADPLLVGKSMSDFKDKTGRPVFREMAARARNEGPGYLVYRGPKGEDQAAALTLCFFKHFEPWNLVVGCEVLLDENNPLLTARAENFAANKPFSLGVQLDPTKCAFGKFLASPETIELMKTFPEFRAAMQAVVEPHRRLHDSAVDIEAAVNNTNMLQALALFGAETLPALEEVRKHFQAAIEAESELEKGADEAKRIYAETTTPNLEKVQELLHQIRAEAKGNIMSDTVMMAAAQGTQRNVILIAGLAFVVGVLLAWLISRGLIRVLSVAADGIDSNSNQVAEAAGQVSQASQNLAEGASQQAASIEETSASLEEMDSMIRQTAENAGQADRLMAETQKVVQRAEASMKEMTTSMEEISSSGSEIGKIIKTIDEIAFQTNLLALNAAVEAARAGEAGQGFAVVADEVRNLAQRAAEAARNTSDLIESTIKKIEQGSTLVREAAEAFNEVAGNTGKVGDLIGEIAEASREQSQGIEQINTAVTQLDQVTQRNAAGVEESASASEQLNAQAEDMRDLVGGLLRLVGRSGSDIDRSRSRTRRIGPGPARPALPGGKREVKPEDVIGKDEDFSDF